MQRNRPEIESQRPRIVDIIAEGLSVAVARPWLLIVPLLVDLFFWLGVKIEPRALMQSLINLINDVSINDSDEVISSFEDLASANMSQLGALFVPSMLSGVPRGDIFEIVSQRVWAPGSSGMVLLVGLGLILAGTLLSMAYSVPIANAILGRSQPIGALIKSVFHAWARLLLLLAIVLGGVIAVVLVSSMAAAAFALIGVDFLPLISLLLVVAAIGAFVYSFFVFDAIVVANVGPITAIRYSAMVVHKNLRPVIGLILATVLLTTGIPEIAESFLGELPGLLIAVLIQALIATGLAAASMIFFVDRLRQWRPELVQLPQSAPAFDLTRQGETHS